MQVQQLPYIAPKKRRSEPQRFVVKWIVGDTNVEDIDWWDCTYSDFKERMRGIGIEVDKMYFSGFWSQGDGACFEGSVSDWGLFLPTVGITNDVLVEFIRNHWSFSVSHSGHYYHENCTSFSTDMSNPDGEDDEWFIERYSPYGVDDFRSVAWLAVLRGFDFSSMEETFRDTFKDHMRQLYKDLEAEYDYLTSDLTSDEAVWESLEANEMTDELEGTCEWSAAVGMMSLPNVPCWGTEPACPVVTKQRGRCATLWPLSTSPTTCCSLTLNCSNNSTQRGHHD